MLSSGINFINFKVNSKTSFLKKKLNFLIKEKNQIIKSFEKNYKSNFDKKKLNKYKKSLNYRIIGMGGSSLGAHAIYDFLKNKIKKNFLFIDNLQTSKKIDKKTNFTNLVISKSGNTTETIVNTNILVKKKIKIFLLLKKKIAISISWQKN